MKYTIHGFSQEKALELGLDEKDLMILRWFVDYKDTGKMVKKIIDEDIYYWVKYEGILEAFPIVNWKKDTVYRRLTGMAKVGVLKHKTIKQGGVWSYYSLGSEYIKLADTSYEIVIGTKVGGSEKNPRESEKNPRGSEKNPNQTDLNPERKTNLLYSSINNTSINNTTTTIDNSCISFKGNLEVFKHFEKCGFLINAMLMDQIAADIEIYNKQWLMDAATEAMNRGKINYKYVLGILQNWKSKGRNAKTNKEQEVNPMKFNNFEAREYDYDDLEKKLLGWDKDDMAQ